MRPDPENSHPLNFDTFVPDYDPSLAQASPHALEPNGVPPVPGEHISRDEAFSRAMGAMYWTGYWTAVYHVRPLNQLLAHFFVLTRILQGHQRSNGEGIENDAVTNGCHEGLETAENAEDEDDDELLVSTQR